MLKITYASCYTITLICICFALCNSCKRKESTQKSVVKSPPICTMNKSCSKTMSCHAGAPSRFTALSGHSKF